MAKKQTPEHGSDDDMMIEDLPSAPPLSAPAPTVQQNGITLEMLQAAMAPFVTMMGQAIAGGIAATQRPKVPLGRYDPRSAAHPNKATAVEMKRTYAQNGYRLSYSTTHDLEIELLNQITRPGAYLSGNVYVVITGVGMGVEENVDIRFKCATPDQRNNNFQYWTSFTDMLTKILAEQKEIDQAALDDAEFRADFRRNRELKRQAEAATVGV